MKNKAFLIYKLNVKMIKISLEIDIYEIIYGMKINSWYKYRVIYYVKDYYFVLNKEELNILDIGLGVNLTVLFIIILWKTKSTGLKILKITFLTNSNISKLDFMQDFPKVFLAYHIL